MKRSRSNSTRGSIPRNLRLFILCSHLPVILKLCVPGLSDMHQIAGQDCLSYRLTSLIISFRHITCHATYSYTDTHCHLALHLLLRVLSAISSSAMHFDRLSSHSFRQPYDNRPRLMSRSTIKSSNLLDQSVSAPYSGMNEHKGHTNKIFHTHIAVFQRWGFAYAPLRKHYPTRRHVYAFSGETRSVR